MRTLIIAGFMLCSFGVQAKNETDSVKTGKDPFYLQLYLGINKSANENLPWTEFSGYPLSTGIFAGIGRELTPKWGWRAALRINRNKSRNVPECESKDVWGWSNTALFGDITFDVTDVFRKSKLIPRDSLHSIRSSRFNLKAFAGLGVAYTWNFDKVPLSYTHPYSRSSKILPAARVGLTATYRISTKWRIGAELSQSLFEDHFNGVAHNIPLDTRTNLKVGLTYLLYKTYKAKKAVLRKEKLRECPKLPLIMPDPENVKLRQIAGRAFLDFPVNEMVIYPDYRNNPNELARIQKTVDSALFDKSVTIMRISLHGYASPESPYSNNTRLAKGRTESLKNFLMKKYRFESGIFRTEFTPEDWENLRGFLKNMDERRVKGDYWYDNKAYVETPEAPFAVKEYHDELLRVIDSDMEPDAKEEKLKQVGGGEPYRWLLTHVYPGLRHTDYIIEYEISPFPVEKSRKLIYTHPEALSMKEMYLVAQSYSEGSEEWVDALVIAAKQFPENKTANLNAACASVKTKRLGDAKKYLKKAGNTKEAQYLGNIILAMEGDVKWKMNGDVLIVIDK